MEKFKTAIVGFGNVGKAVKDAIEQTNDFVLTAIISSSCKSGFDGVEIAKNLNQLKAKPDVAIICAPSRTVPGIALEALNLGINTSDAFDIHNKIAETRRTLNDAAKKNNKAAVTASGWDPGSDSIIRALFLAMAPKGLTYTNFGPGMSLGHSVAAKAIKGVKKALSMTIPLGTSVHRRVVYIELEEGAVFKDAEKAIKSDDYFSHDETHVIQTNDIDSLTDMGHGVHIIRKGVSGQAQNQIFEYNMKINNPSLTGQLLLASARAAMRARPGCYTLIELPLIDFLEGDKEALIKNLV